MAVRAAPTLLKNILSGLLDIINNKIYSNGFSNKKGVEVLNNTDQEIFKLIHESSDPELTARYFIGLCLDYLQTNGPSPKTVSSDLQESA